MKKLSPARAIAIALFLSVGNVPAPDGAEATAVASASGGFTAAPSYRLAANDVVEVRVYQEDDLQTKQRISKDGTATFPLVGNVTLAGKTLDEASGYLRELLGKDFLVNPQVTISVVEYAKRRFTVLGQVQKPGTYEIPSEETVTLLEAIAMAGGYTRLANSSKVSLTRVRDGRRVFLNLDARSASNDAGTKPFEVIPDDTITVPERVF